ncbi:hypothetical protein HPP92_008528 [Vanilla planifolia]|uniref:Gnk2-homologous domain-containing protein n=1 Tax=Vanilla planifolia TaxID=51239 RepID=A0A835V220_VANPL|nr:hypothetical protein HPP92_008528 [Vanilla planifolia]
MPWRPKRFRLQCMRGESHPPMELLCGSAVAAHSARWMLRSTRSLGFRRSPAQMLYKTCGSGGGGGDAYEEKRDTALSSLQGGWPLAVDSTQPATSRCTPWHSARAISKADCGDCVQQAVQKAQVECGGANPDKSTSISAISAIATILMEFPAVEAAAAVMVEEEEEEEVSKRGRRWRSW